ncbi:MAG: ATP-binding protein [Bacteroidota bacterium]
MKEIPAKIPVNLVVVNKDGIIAGCNEYFKKTTGMKLSELKKLHLQDLFSEGSKDFFMNALKLSAKSGEIAENVPAEMIQRDGTKIFFNLNLGPADKKKGYLYCVLKDVSIFKKNEEELIRARKKAEESDRLKTAFLANMSHEIRTPMNAIIGFSELLKIPDIDNRKKEEYAKIISNKGSLLLTLIDDIIEVAKFESGKLSINKTSCDINSLLEELRVIFDEKKKARNKENVLVKLYIPEKIEEPVYTDPGRLQQVLTNLIDNALKFTERGYIEFGYEVKEKYIQFFVKDTGIGIKKKDQKLIFNRFRQVEDTPSKRHGGSGLGLTISKGIVSLLGGKMWLESKFDEGSVFYFTLPLNKAEQPVEETYDNIKETNTSYNWKDKVILVAEDEEVNYRFIEAILDDTEVQLLHAENGVQAIELCESINQIDLVLMDIKMPGLNGYDATRKIKSIRPELPVIAQTAFTMKEEKKKCLQAGCDDYISKPIDIKLLIEKINFFFISK